MNHQTLTSTSSWDRGVALLLLAYAVVGFFSSFFFSLFSFVILVPPPSPASDFDGGKTNCYVHLMLFFFLVRGHGSVI